MGDVFLIQGYIMDKGFDETIVIFRRIRVKLKHENESYYASTDEFSIKIASEKKLYCSKVFTHTCTQHTTPSSCWD